MRLVLLQIIFLSPDFHELWCSMMSICLLTEVKLQWVYVSTWMSDHLSSRPAVGCVLSWNVFVSPDFHKF